ncbi:MAG: hypothetical protein NZZ41_05305 [Candidatus Dojkabacteria bacterium]|nr:hypothetical protein [Candidatus Dojkabacteria bacterium]
MICYKSLTKVFIVFVLLSLLVIPSNTIFFEKIKAAGITNITWTGTGITSNASAVSTAITPTLGFTLSTAITASDAITITFIPQSGVPNNGVILTANLTSSDITPGGGCSGTPVLAGSPIPSGTQNPTLTITGLTCNTSASTLAIAASRFSTNSNAGNVTITITTPYDEGAIMYYIGSSNQVNIYASVAPVLTLAIRNATDTGDLNPGAGSGPRICNMGVLQPNTTPTSPSTNVCEYRLRFSTNASGGLILSYSSSSAAGGLLAKNATVTIPNQVGGSSGDPLTSNNGYGIRISTPAGLTRGASFGTVVTNFYTITNNTSTVMITSSGPFAPNPSPDTTNTVLATHGARIGIAQESGNYTHTVTYTISGTF